MFILVTLYAITGLLILFVAVGFIAFIRALRALPREAQAGGEESGRPLSAREHIRNYVGPVKPEMALLNPPLRVVMEFIAALGGFPGLGWLISGRVFAGLVLMTVVPAIIWALYPATICILGLSKRIPFLPLHLLPILGVVSSATLAIVQRRAAGKRH